MIEPDTCHCECDSYLLLGDEMRVLKFLLFTVAVN
jgi:hypothetical protein